MALPDLNSLDTFGIMARCPFLIPFLAPKVISILQHNRISALLVNLFGGNLGAFCRVLFCRRCLQIARSLSCHAVGGGREGTTQTTTKFTNRASQGRRAAFSTASNPPLKIQVVENVTIPP